MCQRRARNPSWWWLEEGLHRQPILLWQRLIQSRSGKLRARARLVTSWFRFVRVDASTVRERPARVRCIRKASIPAGAVVKMAAGRHEHSRRTPLDSSTGMASSPHRPLHIPETRCQAGPGFALDLAGVRWGNCRSCFGRSGQLGAVEVVHLRGPGVGMAHPLHRALAGGSHVGRVTRT